MQEIIKKIQENKINSNKSYKIYKKKINNKK